MPDRVAYQVHVRHQIPVAIGNIVDDIVHNLRSALDSLAYELAVRDVGRPLKEAEVKPTAFPMRATPDEPARLGDLRAGRPPYSLSAAASLAAASRDTSGLTWP